MVSKKIIETTKFSMNVEIRQGPHGNRREPTGYRRFEGDTIEEISRDFCRWQYDYNISPKCLNKMLFIKEGNRRVATISADGVIQPTIGASDDD